MKEVYIVSLNYLNEDIYKFCSSSYEGQEMAKLSTKIGKIPSQSHMARFMARNSRWPENIFYGEGGSNMAKLEKSGHQMARLATLILCSSSLLLYCKRR